MKSSPKSDDVSASAGLKTPSSGKKLVQARLPFKTLSGSEPPVTALNDDVMAANAVNSANKPAVESRKRKPTTELSADDSIRAPKINRRNNSDETNELLTSETLDASIDLTFEEEKCNAGKNDADCSTERNSESKENVNENIGDAETANDDSVVMEDDSETPRASKAKQSLDFTERRSGTRKSKRLHDENLITIKIPVPKKKKKKSIKNSGDSAKVDKSESEMADADVDEAKPSTSSASSEASPSDENKEADRSVLDDSMVSNASVDSQNLVTTPKLTQKQQRRIESEKKQLEKQRAKEERDRKLQEEKEQRQREKEERERKKQEEREQQQREKEERERKKQEEKEQQQREKEERERKKQEDKEQQKREREEKEEQRKREKEEERKRKEEQKEEERRKREEQKELDRKRKEEEKRLKEEAEQNKYKKSSEAFVKFFVPKKVDAKAEIDPVEKMETELVQNFMSFQVKDDMKIAPITRRTLNMDERSAFDGQMSSNINEDSLYLKQLKKKEIVARKSGRTYQAGNDEKEDDDDICFIDEAGQSIQLIEEKPKKIYRVKFLKFHENRRPPYYGTWRKKSKKLNPRNPFAQDSALFEYEVDSDDEWEEEEPGESLHGSDDEKDQESDDDYDIDNDFFVPHGHLSDEEMQDEDDVEMYDNNPENQKVKLKIIQEEFADEMKKKTQKLKPRALGLFWQNSDGTQPPNCSNGVWNLFQKAAFLLEGQSVKVEPRSPTDQTNEPTDDDDDSNKAVRRLKIQEKDVPDLIRLIYGNRNGSAFLINEFRAYLAKKNSMQRQYSLASIRNKIKELAVWQPCPEQGPIYKKLCWYVSIQNRKRYALDDLTLPNDWQYITELRKPVEIEDPEVGKDKKFDDDMVEVLSDSNSCGPSETLTLETIKQASSKSSAFNIAKFIRVLSEEEKKKQFGSLTLRRDSSEMGEAPTVDLTLSPTSSTKSKPTAGTKRTAKKPLAAAPKEKKRISLLHSAPCGQDISPRLKTTLVTQFLNSNNKNKKSTDNKANDSPSTSTAGTSGGSKTSNAEKSVIVID